MSGSQSPTKHLQVALCARHSDRNRPQSRPGTPALLPVVLPTSFWQVAHFVGASTFLIVNGMVPLPCPFHRAALQSKERNTRQEYSTNSTAFPQADKKENSSTKTSSHLPGLWYIMASPLDGRSLEGKDSPFLFAAYYLRHSGQCSHIADAP